MLAPHPQTHKMMLFGAQCVRLRPLQWLLIAIGRLKIRQSTIYYTGLLGPWANRIVDQMSDVQVLLFFHYFLALGHSKLFWKYKRIN